MGTELGNVATDVAALKVKLDALIKDAEEAEEKCKDRWTKRGGVNWAFFKI
jgi:hypothetical protein